MECKAKRITKTKQENDKSKTREWQMQEKRIAKARQENNKD